MEETTNRELRMRVTKINVHQRKVDGNINHKRTWKIIHIDYVDDDDERVVMVMMAIIEDHLFPNQKIDRLQPSLVCSFSLLFHLHFCSSLLHLIFTVGDGVINELAMQCQYQKVKRCFVISRRSNASTVRNTRSIPTTFLQACDTLVTH